MESDAIVEYIEWKSTTLCIRIRSKIPRRKNEQKKKKNKLHNNRNENILFVEIFSFSSKTMPLK